MNKLLYYPDFEVKNSNWLKFALLYLPELNTIVPYEGDVHLSTLYEKINSESDLLKKIRPDYELSWVTSKESIAKISEIISKPTLFFPEYNAFKKVQSWRNNENHKYTLFRGKYRIEFEEFCISEGLAHQTRERIAMPRELANIFMTNLANNMEIKEGYSLITPYLKYNQLSTLIKMDWQVSRKTNVRSLSFAKEVIELLIPQNLEEISFERILKIRSKSDYISNMKYFNRMIESYYDRNTDSEISKIEFLNDLRKSNIEFVGEILTFASGVTSVALGSYIMLQNPTSTILDGVKQGVDLVTLTGAGINYSNSKLLNKPKKKRKKICCSN